MEFLRANPEGRGFPCHRREAFVEGFRLRAGVARGFWTSRASRRL